MAGGLGAGPEPPFRAVSGCECPGLCWVLAPSQRSGCFGLPVSGGSVRWWPRASVSLETRVASVPKPSWWWPEPPYRAVSFAQPRRRVEPVAPGQRPPREPVRDVRFVGHGPPDRSGRARSSRIRWPRATTEPRWRAGGEFEPNSLAAGHHRTALARRWRVRAEFVGRGPPPAARATKGPAAAGHHAAAAGHQGAGRRGPPRAPAARLPPSRAWAVPAAGGRARSAPRPRRPAARRDGATSRTRRRDPRGTSARRPARRPIAHRGRSPRPHR